MIDGSVGHTDNRAATQSLSGNVTLITDISDPINTDVTSTIAGTLGKDCRSISGDATITNQQRNVNTEALSATEV